MSARDLINEIRSQHYSNVGKPERSPSDNGNPTVYINEDLEEGEEETPVVGKPVRQRRKRKMKNNEDAANKEPDAPVKRRRRRMKTSEASSGIVGTNMFSVTLVGVADLPDYPLEKGEKLAIVKLTPIANGGKVAVINAALAIGK